MKIIPFSFGLVQTRVGTYRAYVIFGVVLLLGLALALFIVKPRVVESIKTNEEVGQLKTQLDKLNQKRSELESLDEGQIQTMVNQATLALPSRKDIPGLVASVENLVGSNQLTLNSISLTPGSISTESGQVVQKEEKGTLNVQLSLTGSLENVKNFLAKAVSSARLLSIDTLSLRAQEGDNLNVGLSVSYFYQEVPTLVPKIDEPVAKLTDQENEILNKVFAFEYQSRPFQASPSSKTNPFVD